MVLKLLAPSVQFLVSSHVPVQRNVFGTLGRFLKHNSPGIRLQSTKSNWKSSPLVSSLWTIPNVLTLSRIASAPVIGHFIMTQNLTPALCLFTYSCITDFLDGFIARKYNKKSVTGTVLDPMADKLLMITATYSLAFPPGPQIIPLSIASLILGRDLLLGLSAIYFRYASMRHTYGRVTWRSYSDIFNYPSAEVKPTKISKWNTFLQMLYLGWAIVLMIQDTQHEEDQKDMEEQPGIFSRWFPYAGYIVATTTVLSGASYAFNKNTIRYLSKKR